MAWPCRKKACHPRGRCPLHWLYIGEVLAMPSFVWAFVVDCWQDICVAPKSYKPSPNWCPCVAEILTTLLFWLMPVQLPALFDNGTHERRASADCLPAFPFAGRSENMKIKDAEGCGLEWDCSGTLAQLAGPIESGSGFEKLDLSKCPRTSAKFKI